VSGPVLEMLGIRVDDFKGDQAAFTRAAGTRRSARYCELPSPLAEPFLDFVFHRVNAQMGKQQFRVSGEPMFNQNSRFLGYRGIGVEVMAAP
jgi:hypothetical protein